MHYNKKIIFMIMAFLALNSAVFSQVMSLNMKNVTVKQAISELKKQTGYSFVYSVDDLDTQKSISVSVQNGKIEEAVKQILIGQDLSYEIQGKNIVVKKNSKTDQDKKAKKVTGIIIDEKDDPLAGVNIVVKGTSFSAVSDFDGHFSVEAPENGTLAISFIGYDTQNLTINGRSSLKVKLFKNAKNLEEVVITGYSSQKKKNITGSVVTMKVSEDVRLSATTSAANLLKGRMAGVYVSSQSGVPGSNPEIRIRQNSSFLDSNGNSIQRVLYVIDGVVKDANDFNNLAPNEIETFTVLKDAAAASIYGARAAGGVILVTTRRGEYGKVKIDYSYSYGFDTRTKNIELTSAVDLGRLYNRMHPPSNAGYYTPEDFAHLQTLNNGWGYDQLDEIWTNPTIITQNFSVSGGNDKIKYFGGVSNVKQTTFVKAYGYEKTNVRFNTTVNVSKNLQFFAGMGLSNRNTEADSFEGPAALYSKLLVWQPWQPIYTDAGKYITYHWIGNIGAESNRESGYNSTNDFKPDVNLNLVYKIPFIEGLSAKAAYAASVSNTHYAEYRKKYLMAVMKESANGYIVSTKDADIKGYDISSNWYPPYLKKQATWGDSQQLNLQLNYDHTFGKHVVSGMFGYEAAESNSAQVYGARERVPLYLTDQFWAFSDSRADDWAGGDPTRSNGRKSFFGEASYSYNNKYLFRASFREDGSMNFAPDQRWGFFPGVSAGWVISEEDFFGSAKDIFSRVKLRASAALTGNDSVGGWQWEQSYKTGDKSFFGEGGTTISQGVKYGDIVNPDITWEKTLSYNFAVDLDFCKHWSSTLEYYIQDTYDILGPREASVPTSFSGKLPSENYGEVKAQGVDFNIDYRNKVGAFNYYVSANASYAWDKVITRDYAKNTQEVNIPVGKSIYRVTGYRFDQILRTQAQLDAFNVAHPGYKINGWAPQLGMMTYKDLSGPNGVPDNVINDYDKTDLVKSNIPVYFGFNVGGDYKGLSFEAVFSGSAGSKKSYQDVTANPEWNRQYQGWVNDSWTPENPNATLPKLFPNSNSPKSTVREGSDFWLKDNDYIRLSYLQVGYNFKQLGKLSGVNNLKLYVTGSNLFSIGTFKYWDAQGSAFGYPIMKSFSIGLNIGF